MSQKQKSNETDGPTVAGVLLSGISMAFVGAFLGFLFLSSFPLTVVGSAQDRDAMLEERSAREPLPNDGYVFEAAVARNRNWELLRAGLVSGRSEVVEFQFEDLNAWATSVFRPATPPPGADQPNVLLLPGTPKFGTDGNGQVYMNLPVNVTVRGYSKAYKVFAVGHFPEGSRSLEVESVFINNAAVPPVPGLSAYVLNSFMDAFKQSDEYKELSKAWQSVEAVEVTQNSLRLKL